MVFTLCLLICMLQALVLTDCKGQRKRYCKSLTLKDGGNAIGIDDESYNTVRLAQGAWTMSTIEDRDAILSPTIIVIPKTEKEIVEIIEYAKECHYTISIKSGGHQYSGLSSCNGSKGKCIQIDMKHFDHIHYDKDNDKIKSITVGAGVKLVDLYTANQANDVAILGGICASVGAGGHYQSSSQSVWSRSLGLGMDYIIRLKIITANGETRNLYKNTDNDDEKDLFWAILGGSPGSWGVVIEYEFEPIKNSNYPHSAYYSYAHVYTKEGFTAFFKAFLDLLNNPYYHNYNDLSVFFGGQPILTDHKTSSSMIATGMNMNLMWSGIDNNDIHSMIPNHPTNKTWHQELIQPFAAIDALFVKTQMKDLKYEGPTSISEFLFNKASTIGQSSVIPPFRVFEVASQYNATKLNQLFSDKIKTQEWIQSIVNKFDELAADITDNIEILWQFWDLFRKEGHIMNDNHDIYISHDPLENPVSYPLRAMRLQSDNVVLFGDGDSYSDDVKLKGKQHQSELKQILTGNEIISDIQSYAYTDLMADEYDLNKQFNEFYNYREDIYKKLRDIKTRVDGDDIFKGPLTIPPIKSSCDANNHKVN